jgi:heme-degrading monooxygenase HmoA
LIIRVLRGRVPPDFVEYFHQQANQALGALCPDNGCAWARIGRQIHSDHSEEVVMVTAWENMDALYDWIGSRDLLGTPFNNGEGSLFESFDVQHYEMIEGPLVETATESGAGLEAKSR